MDKERLSCSVPHPKYGSESLLLTFNMQRALPEHLLCYILSLYNWENAAFSAGGSRIGR